MTTPPHRPQFSIRASDRRLRRETDQETWPLVEREGFDDLLRRPYNRKHEVIARDRRFRRRESEAEHAKTNNIDLQGVLRVVRTGMKRSTSTWKDADDAIHLERTNEGSIDINLQFFEYPAGATYRFGDAFVTMAYRFGE